MKKIGVLTSGGDAPGMNAAIRAVVKTAIANGIQPIGFIKGYNGILEKNYHVMDRESVSGIIHSGGTILKTARCMEFYEASYREKAFHNAKEIGLDGLVVIGGDGSYRGAGYLSELGLPCIGVPGTIDNDIASTEYTIGYDTAMNTVVECVDKLNDTCQSHERCSVVRGYLKGKSALMIFDKHANLKYKFGNRHFWAEGYYVSTVGLNEATIKKYIQEQEKHDIAMDKLSVKEYEDPFKG